MISLHIRCVAAIWPTRRFEKEVAVEGAAWDASHQDERCGVDDPQREHDPTGTAHEKPGDSSHFHSSMYISWIGYFSSVLWKKPLTFGDTMFFPV